MGRIFWYSGELYQRFTAAVSANSRMTIRFGSGPPSISSVAPRGPGSGRHILHDRGADRHPVGLECIKPTASIVASRLSGLPFQPLIAAPSAAPPKLAFRYAHRPSLQKGFAFPRRSEINRVAAAVQFSKPLFDVAEPPVAELFVPVWDKARHGPVVSGKKITAVRRLSPRQRRPDFRLLARCLAAAQVQARVRCPRNPRH